MKKTWSTNPIIEADFPDPDIIRVEDAYYMASTTMHFMPGCDILRSYDLLNWELIAHAYDILEDTEKERLENNENAYGQGMWAPSLRFHQGTFYITFTANDTQRTYLLTAKDPCGPWKKTNIDGFYHDNSLFFDDDGRVYIVYGNKEIWLTELRSDLTGPKAGGLHRLLAVDEENIHLGFEGSHLYKYKDFYLLFCCHMLAYGSARKSQVCFKAASLQGEFLGKCIIDDDMGYHNLGVAQGGMVDSPDGIWYAFMFQDRGAVGRSPVIAPMEFFNGYPVVGDNGMIPEHIESSSARPGYRYESLYGDDDFEYQQDSNGKVNLKLFWQFNHIPQNDLWTVTQRRGAFRLYSGKLCVNVLQSKNTLTQRTFGPRSSACITIDGSRILDGDYAGISAFMSCYGFVALTKSDGQYYLVMQGKPANDESIFGEPEYGALPVEYERLPYKRSYVRLKVTVDYTDKRDEARFCYWTGRSWKQIGITSRLYFKMDHFTGCRFGLCYYSTMLTGGCADFIEFRYHKE